MPTTRAPAKANNGTPHATGSTPRGTAGAKSKAPKAAASKPAQAKAEKKTVDEKLKKAKQNREKMSSPPPKSKEEIHGSESPFGNLPLEAVFEPKETVSLSEIISKSAKPAAEKDELAELAFLGVNGTTRTPSGRRWRSRMKETSKPAPIAPMPIVGEEVEVA